MLTIKVANFAKAIENPWYKVQFLVMCQEAGIKAFTLKGWYQFINQAIKVSMALTKEAEKNFPEHFEECKNKTLFLLSLEREGLKAFYLLYHIKHAQFEQIEWKIIQTLNMTVRQFEDLIHRETDGLVVRAVVREHLN